MKPSDMWVDRRDTPWNCFQGSAGRCISGTNDACNPRWHHRLLPRDRSQPETPLGVAGNGEPYVGVFTAMIDADDAKSEDDNENALQLFLFELQRLMTMTQGGKDKMSPHWNHEDPSFAKRWWRNEVAITMLAQAGNWLFWKLPPWFCGDFKGRSPAMITAHAATCLFDSRQLKHVFFAQLAGWMVTPTPTPTQTSPPTP